MESRRQISSRKERVSFLDTFPLKSMAELPDKIFRRTGATGNGLWPAQNVTGYYFWPILLGGWIIKTTGHDEKRSLHGNKPRQHHKDKDLQEGEAGINTARQKLPKRELSKSGKHLGIRMCEKATLVIASHTRNGGKIRLDELNEENHQRKQDSSPRGSEHSLWLYLRTEITINEISRRKNTVTFNKKNVYENWRSVR